MFRRPTASEFFPHSRNPAEILWSALGSFLPANLPGALYNKAIWNGVTAMGTLQHARSLEKASLRCQPASDSVGMEATMSSSLGT